MIIRAPDKQTDQQALNKFTSGKSMFGLKTPISKCRKRINSDDFDGIRSILLHSRVTAMDNWIPYVQKHGDLFYVHVKDSCQQGQTTGQGQDRYYYLSDTPVPNR